MIVFDEVAFAKEVEKRPIDNTYYSFKKGVILAKLYFNEGYSEDEVRKKLENKFSILDESYNYNIKYIKISKMIEQAKLSPELTSKSISFSCKELEFIHKFDDISVEKLFFVLLCVSKYYNNSFYFYDREIFSIAHVAWKGSYSKKVFSYLIQKDYLTIEERGIKNNRKIRKLFYSMTDIVISLYNENDIAFTVDNYKNIVYYYLKYFNLGKFIICKDCGAIDTWEKNKLRCTDCSSVRNLEKKRINYHNSKSCN